MRTCCYRSEAKREKSFFLHLYNFQNLLITGDTENQHFWILIDPFDPVFLLLIFLSVVNQLLKFDLLGQTADVS